VAAGAATATVVKCGQVVTKSITLANSLSNCHGNGLVIGANNLTIDLAGHSISGVNTRGTEGIADDGHPGAHIQNGTIQRFFLNGVGLRGAPHSVVSNMTIQGIGAGNVEGDASAGVLVKNSAGTSVANNKISNNVVSFQSDGVDVLSSPGTTVRGNVLAANSWDGMVVLFSPDSIVSANTVQGNKNQGLELNGNSDRSVVSGNFAGNNAVNGLTIGASSKVRIEGNFLKGNGENGLFFFDLNGSVVRNNQAGGNAVGIALERGQFGSANNQLLNNQTNRNRFAGVIVEGADHNLLQGNTSDANQGPPGEGGGFIIAAAKANILRANVAIGNLDVGIGFFEDTPGDAKGNVLIGNFVTNNHAHGIDAVAGTIDGGGNIARGNTPPPQCVGVTCKPA
jgi:parallel beta-helix repeat protein